MGSAIVVTTMLFIFFLRDVQLLAVSGPSRTKLAVYGGLNATYLTALMALLSATGVQSPILLFRAPPFWMISILWHCLFWTLCLASRRSGRVSFCWLAALFPVPVLLVSLAAAALRLHSITAAIGIFPISLAFAIAWFSAVAFAVSRLGTAMAAPRVSADQARFAIDFAAMANVTALILVPVEGIVGGLRS